MEPSEESHISSRELADISRLADDTLAAKLRADVEQRVAASPELRDRYERERQVVLALRKTASERAPQSLRARIQSARSGAARTSGRRLVLAGTAAAAVLAAVLLAVLVLPAGTPAAPSVSEAAVLAFRGSTQSAPAPDPRAPESLLNLSVQRLYFPNWSRGPGWAAVGQRTDHLAGRRAVTVYYQGHGANVAYTIVSGPALVRPVATRMHVGGRELRLLSIDGRLLVTWRRGGHTCLLSGTGVTARELAQLAVRRYGGG